jgi:outer membrane protein OmpA-like peptidoglycan-associated protein
MIRKLILKLSLVICLGFFTLSVTAQQVNTLYFMENVPVRNIYNPAFQPLSDFYLSLPILGFTQFSVGNNSLSQKDIVYKLNGKSIYFLNEFGDKDKFYNALKSTTALQTNLQTNLLSFGFRKNDAYWSFSLNEKVEIYAGVPKDIMKLLLYGTPDKDNNNVYDFKSLGMDASAYTEAALGYSKIINEKLTIGAKLKFLYGSGNVSMTAKNLDLTANMDQWTLKGTTQMNYSSPANLRFNNFESLVNNSFEQPANVIDYFKPSGLGGGVDLGVTYKPINELTLSAAITDLGFIRWNKNAKNVSTSIDRTFTGFGELSANSNLNFTFLTDSIVDALKTTASSTTTSNSYTTYTSAKFNVGAEYAFLENKLSVGVLSRTIKHNQNYYEELTGSVNGRPVDWFNMSLSYSVLNGQNTMGAGIGVRTGCVNWFLTADYIPFKYSSITSGSTKITVPYNSKALNFAIGINLVLGNNKDTDHDGVVDKRDKCPETPFSVIVDKKGCPIDADGDGVPDYLDKCPKTPKEAYNSIDQHGCPVDNDSDGVADYKDKCPDTPKESIGYVDSLGCSIDTDKDGVFDYKDKCPNTPLGAKVDSVGCPLDTDGDSVPDYKDKCPNTPLEAKGHVDQNGCPLDGDLDGVPDYMDKCPNTPPEERNSVDKDGCTVKRIEVKELDKLVDKAVDKTLDTDGDGVPDYIDNCPKVKGTVANHGCPELKKEVQNLFHKALQGIKFESGKYTILPVSYTILNQIAGVMIANPSYIIEIRGHTDNAGKPAANLTLSTNRAKAVMKYLISKKVAAGRMIANGYGDTLPVTTNKTPAGRATNRRVEFVVSFEEITFE